MGPEHCCYSTGGAQRQPVPRKRGSRTDLATGAAPSAGPEPRAGARLARGCRGTGAGPGRGFPARGPGRPGRPGRAVTDNLVNIGGRSAVAGPSADRHSASAACCCRPSTDRHGPGPGTRRGATRRGTGHGPRARTPGRRSPGPPASIRGSLPRLGRACAGQRGGQGHHCVPVCLRPAGRLLQRSEQAIAGDPVTGFPFLERLNLSRSSAL